MALVRRENGFYYIDLTIGKRRVRKSTGTKDRQEAKKLHDKIANERWAIEKLGETPRKTWKEAVVKYIKRLTPSYIRINKSQFTFLDKFIGNYYLDEIDKPIIQEMGDARLEISSAATVNKMLVILRAILRAAHNEWGWLHKIPYIKLLKVNNERTRWLTREEANRLLAELPSHLRIAATFALATGLRANNLKNLTWRQIDFDTYHAYVEHWESKTKKAIPIPLNEDALRILKSQPRINDYVFNYEGKPINQLNTKAFRKALKRANIKNFCWHDLRHTWASWHVQNGTSLQELQQLGGWSSIDMVLRYAHLTSKHLQQAANRINDTNMSQSEETEKQ